VSKLRELLEPKGLWDKIVDVNSVSLRNLLRDEPILLESAKEMEEITYYLSMDNL
jgi:hypothetical protein